MLKTPKNQKPPIEVRKLSIQELATQALERTKVARTKKIAKAESNGRVVRPLLMSIWSTAFKASYPSYPCAATDVDLTILQKHLSAIAKNSVSQVKYLEFVIAYWTTIITNRFGWMKQSPPPEYPSIRFMVKFKEAFQAAFAEEAEIVALAGGSIKDKLVHQHVKTGLSRAGAEAAVSEMFKPKTDLETVSKIKAQREADLADEQAFRDKAAQAGAMPQKPPIRVRTRAGAVQPSTNPGSFPEWLE